jgi:tetratricopeptide (TPR) repeat protein
MMRREPRYKKGDKIGGRYLVHDVKMGGMGEVYLCLNLEIIYPFALKTFQQPYLTNQLSVRKAFEHEVLTWVGLEKHPNIVRCFQMDTFDNQPFMVLEWIRGEERMGTDLRGWVRHGSLDVCLALDFAIDICRGLCHAREKQPGMVHRDLKPENVLVTLGKLAKVTDFGLAQIAVGARLEIHNSDQDGRHSLSCQRGIAGTPPYMPPEQWQGLPPDERDDIYALGCIIFEMLTGQPPFVIEGRPRSAADYRHWLSAWQHQHEAIERPTLPPTVPEGIRGIVRACLARQRLDRPDSVPKLLEMLLQTHEHLFRTSLQSLASAEAFTAQEYNDRGVTYADLRQYDLALADFTRAIEIKSNYGQAYSNRGNIYEKLQQYDQALADYLCAIDIDPSLAKAYAGQANVYMELHQYDQALSLLNHSIEVDPNEAFFYSNRGLIYRQLQQYDLALADFVRAIEVDPNFAPAYLNRGLTYANLQQYNQALTDFNQAIKLNPVFAKAYYSRGLTYSDFQENNLALADFNRAIELSPDDAAIYISRGNLNYALKQYELALDDYNYAIELNPKYVEAYLNRGTTYQTLQRFELALADFDRAIELNPKYVEAYLNRGNTYAALQQYDHALDDFNYAIELNPKNAEAYLNRGNTYDELQQYDRALDDYNQAIELDPNFAVAYNNRGHTYQILQLYDQALADYDHAIQINPNYTRAYVNRGSTLADLQQYEPALVDFIQVIELDPSHGQAYCNIGAIYGNWGQLRRALPYFETAAQLGYPLAVQYVAQVRQELGEGSLPQPDPIELAFQAFVDASSSKEMEQAVEQFSFMITTDFISSVEQIIVDLPTEDRPIFEQRLAWLLQLGTT